MQGYIIRINPCRDEDLIVNILTQNSIQTAYRFYGARHSTINLGYKIDAELIRSAKSNMPQLRNVLHLAYSWQHENHRMLIWQSFMQLFYKHLRGIEDIDEFYFELLDSMTKPMTKQNPKRTCIEAYLRLLEHEGRLNTDSTCFLCEEKIQTQDLSLARGYLPAHNLCINSQAIPGAIELLKTKSTMLLSDIDVEKLWRILLEGL